MRVLFVDLSVSIKDMPALDGPRGGRVNSLCQVTDYLSAAGISVEVLCDIKTQGLSQKDVLWTSEPTRKGYDIIVFNRGIGSGLPEIQAKHRVLWTHDLPHSGFIPDPKRAAALSATVFMSGYGERVWRSFYRHIGRGVTIPNGVDRSTFFPREKDENYLIFASAPNRGLARLPLIFQSINSRMHRHFRMHAYSNLSVLHPGEVPHDTRDDIRNGFSLEFGSCEAAGINCLDPIPQKDLAVELGKASLMLLPTDYPEICSNVVLQSLACGTPVVTTGRIGATAEWIVNKQNGMLTEWHPVDYMVYQIDFIRKSIEAISRIERLRRKAANTKIMSWEEVGSAWHKLLIRLR